MRRMLRDVRSPLPCEPDSDSDSRETRKRGQALFNSKFRAISLMFPCIPF